MVNVTVVNGKETVKYLVRIVIGIIIVSILARFFCVLKNKNSSAKSIENTENTEEKDKENGTLIKAMSFCIDEEIPLIKISKEIKDEEIIEPYKLALTKELRNIRFC